MEDLKKIEEKRAAGVYTLEIRYRHTMKHVSFKAVSDASALAIASAFCIEGTIGVSIQPYGGPRKGDLYGDWTWMPHLNRAKMMRLYPRYDNDLSGDILCDIKEKP